MNRVQGFIRGTAVCPCWRGSLSRQCHCPAACRWYKPLFNSRPRREDWKGDGIRSKHVEVRYNFKGLPYMRDWIKTALGLIFLAGLVGLLLGEASLTRVKAQQTTDTTPSYNGTSTGSIITVTYTDGANVRAGPGSYDYPEVGPKLLTGDTALALGRSPGGDWIEIAYPSATGGVGWVYAALVSLPSGSLPIIQPPPTLTPLVTSTMDLTMVAAFPTQVIPTNPPTYTAPPPLRIPTFIQNSKARPGLPAGWIILGLAIVGALGVVITFLHRE